MKLRPTLGAALVLALLVPGTALAQDPTPGPGLALPRAVEAAYANGTRSEDGRPGPAYWQNTATHDIQLTVMPPDRTVRGTETITYHNDSPQELKAVPIRLYLNAHRPTAMREEVYPESFLTDGVIINSFAYNGTDAALGAGPGLRDGDGQGHPAPRADPGRGAGDVRVRLALRPRRARREGRRHRPDDLLPGLLLPSHRAVARRRVRRLPGDACRASTWRSSRTARAVRSTTTSPTSGCRSRCPGTTSCGRRASC